MITKNVSWLSLMEVVIEPEKSDEEKINMEVCLSNSTAKVHLFKIIRRSGRRTGTPSWRCVYCNEKIKSS